MAVAEKSKNRNSGPIKTAGKTAHSGDSREKLLKDVMREMNVELDKKSPSERASAIKEIHSIAVSVRQSRAKSSGL
jgi:hypothetical protein